MNARLLALSGSLLIGLPAITGCGGGGSTPQQAVSKPVEFKSPSGTAAAAPTQIATQPTVLTTPADAATTESPTPAASATEAATPMPQQAAAQPTSTPPPAVPTPTQAPAPTIPAPVQLTVVMKDETFTTTALNVKASQAVTVIERNDGKEIHNWALCQTTDCSTFVAEGDLIAAGKQSPVQFTLTQPGTYKFECEVHSKTMVGTLVVS